ncbi:MAG: DEAD/DEAH box helicase [Butyricicoccus sp.]
MSHISRRSPARMDVVSLLSDGGAMSQKEIVYMTGVSDAALRDMTKKGILRAEYEEVLRAPDFSEVPRAAAPVLSAAQQQAYDGMAALMDENAPRAALLFGVTGSGKTQVYLQLIAHALEQGKSAIVLVPEIGLTPQLLRQFAARFGEEVAVLHSALSAGERYDSFKKIKTGRARVVIGTRSAVFAPAKNLGVIIIDEEQERHTARSSRRATMRGMWQSTGRRRRTHCSCSARQHRRSRRITAQNRGNTRFSRSPSGFSVPDCPRSLSRTCAVWPARDGAASSDLTSSAN